MLNVREKNLDTKSQSGECCLFGGMAPVVLAMSVHNYRQLCSNGSMVARVLLQSLRGSSLCKDVNVTDVLRKY